MKKFIGLAGCFLFSAYALLAQDEGVISKRERIERNMGVFISGGGSFTLDKNIGDYSNGFNLEAGFLKRMNRVLSVGPSISYLSFKYDPEKTGFNNVFIGGPYEDDQGDLYHQGLYFNLSGGKLSLISLAVNLKLNFIPVKDGSKVSVYAFAKPFITSATRDEVRGKGVLMFNYNDIESSDDWAESYREEFDWVAGSAKVKQDYGLDVSNDLKKQTKITGGIFLGPGVEFFPAGKISGFLQASIGYTFPVSYISTKVYENDKNYGNDLDVFIENIEDYPLTKKGFPSVNIQFGASFNF
jgi:hypothetical protein